MASESDRLMSKSKRREVKVVDVRDAERSPPGALQAFLRWFGQDLVLRRISLLAGGALGLFIVGYIVVHMLMLAPVVLLAVFLVAYGISGRRRVSR
jgi:hypothetical protein